MEAKMRRLRAMADSWAAKANETADELDVAKAQRDRAKREAFEAKREIHRLEEQAATDFEDLREARMERDRLRDQVVRLKRERDEARTELAGFTD